MPPLFREPRKHMDGCHLRGWCHACGWLPTVVPPPPTMSAGLWVLTFSRLEEISICIFLEYTWSTAEQCHWEIICQWLLSADILLLDIKIPSEIPSLMSYKWGLKIQHLANLICSHSNGILSAGNSLPTWRDFNLWPFYEVGSVCCLRRWSSLATFSKTPNLTYSRESLLLCKLVLKQLPAPEDEDYKFHIQRIVIFTS